MNVIIILAIIMTMTMTMIPLMTGPSITAYACQTNAEGCQKTQEAGTPAGDSPPEVSGCHFFGDTQQCVRESTPP